MKRPLGFTVFVMLLIVGAWATLTTLRPSKPKPGYLATANLVRVVQDDSGVRHATLLVSNAGRNTICLQPLFGLENRSGQWRTNLIPTWAKAQNRNLMGVLPFHPQAKLLRTGESYEVEPPLPFDDSSWQACFWYFEKSSQLSGFLDKLSTILGQPNRQDVQQIAVTAWTN
jgi:hypothetical protein